jgi:hypothetical protein
MGSQHPIPLDPNMVRIAGTSLPAEAVLVVQNHDGSMTAVRMILTHHSATNEYGLGAGSVRFEGDLLGTLRDDEPDQDSIGAAVLMAARDVMPGHVPLEARGKR